MKAKTTPSPPRKRKGGRKTAKKRAARRRTAKEPAQRALLVLGMHRSGTSAVAGVLRELGVEFGSALMPSAPDNPSGFFEHAEISGLHDQMLLQVGSSWHDARPARLDPDDKRLTGSLEELARIVERDFGNAPIWAVKDPRLCRTLPLWLQMMSRTGCAPSALLVFRHPLEVAESLESRNGFSTARSLLLWVRYNVEAERHTRDWPRAIVRYGDLLDDWRGLTARVVSDCRLGLPAPSRKAAGAVRRFLDPELRHYRSADAALGDDPALGSWVEKTLEALEHGASGRDAEMRSAFDEIGAQLQASDALVTPLLVEGEELLERLEERNRALVQATGDVTDLKSQLTEAGETLANQRHDLALSAQQIQARDTRIQDLQDASIETQRINKQLEKTAKHERKIASRAINSLERTLTTERESSTKAVEVLEEALRADRESTKAAIENLEQTLQTERDVANDRANSLQQTLVAERESATQSIRDLQETIHSDRKTTRETIQTLQTTLQVERSNADDRVEGLEQALLAEQVASTEAIGELQEASAQALGELSDALGTREAETEALRSDHAEACERIETLRVRANEFEAKLAHEREASNRSVRASEQEIAHYREAATHLHKTLEETEQRTRIIATQAQELESQVGAILQSRSYRASAPLRAIGDGVRGLGVWLGRIEAMLWRQLRRCFLALPGTARHKYRLKAFVFRRFSFLFRRTTSYQSWLNLVRVLQETPSPEQPIVSYGRDAPALFANLHEDEAQDNRETSPMLSVVIPVYGQLELTQACLDSVFSVGARRAFEVIVVDDASEEDVHAALAARDDIVLLRNSENLGFVESCNRGARAAQGALLVFLNNDTVVQANWLDELAQTFVEFPDAGLVGGQLVFPPEGNDDTGRLQEAGGILWRNGSAWNYGRGDDPSLPQYAYARSVDYCSGACLAVPTALFAGLGGFDSLFAPGYCEDSDLALKIASLGLRVVYQPEARVVHLDGGSSRSNPMLGMKRFQDENTRKLFTRWRNRLLTHAAPGEHPDLEKDRGISSRVLFIDACTPTPDQDAGSVTAVGLMRGFQDLGYKVTFVPEDNFLYLNRYTRALQRVGIECLYLPHYDSLESVLASRGREFDVVVVFRYPVAVKHMANIRRHAPQAKIVFHTSDLHFLREEREERLQAPQLKNTGSARTRREELATIAEADCTIVHSTAEHELLARALPDAFVYTFPWILDLVGRENGYAERHDIVFLGGYGHPPNVDAAQYFATKIFPIVRRTLPGARFVIAGANPPKELRQIACEDIVVTGYVEDLRTIFEPARVAVAPIRYGAGIKGKIAMAMSYGVPNVATTVGAEGMGLKDGKEVLVADDPQAFADAVVSLYRNEELWDTLSGAGLQYIEEGYSVARGRQRIGEILHAVGSRPFDAACTLCGSLGLTTAFGCSACGAHATELRLGGALLSIAGPEGAEGPTSLKEWMTGQQLPRVLILGELPRIEAELEPAATVTTVLARPGDDPFPLPRGTFDLILSGEATARTRDDGALWQALRSRTNPRGWHLACVPFDPSSADTTSVESDNAPDGRGQSLQVNAFSHFGHREEEHPVRYIYGRDLLRSLAAEGDEVRIWDAKGSPHGLSAGQPVLVIRRKSDEGTEQASGRN